MWDMTVDSTRCLGFTWITNQSCLCRPRCVKCPGNVALSSVTLRLGSRRKVVVTHVDRLIP